MSGKAKPRLRGAKTGVNQNEEREKRIDRAASIRGQNKGRDLGIKRGIICPAADALYDRYGEAIRTGKVAEWRAALIKAYQDCKSLNFSTCEPSEVGDLIDILADMKIEQKTASGGGKMVGGNITAHFIRLQEWLTPKLARGAAAISDCAKWFINKILDGLTAIGEATVAGANIAFFASMDLARTALGNNDTQTFQYLLAFCGMITSNTYAAGDTVYGWLQGATGATFGAVVQPYIDVFTQHMIELLTTQQELFVGKIPGVSTTEQFDAWLKTLTMGDFMTAVATMIAAGKWAAVGVGGAKLTFNILLTTGYYGILAAAWSMDGYVLTGAWLTYYGYNSLDDESWIKQGVVDVKQRVVDALKYIDNVIAGKIKVKDMAMEQVEVLNHAPKARALVLARLDNKIVQAKLKRAEAGTVLTHEKAVKEKLEQLGVLFKETDRIAEAALEIQMSNSIMEARFEKRTSGITDTNEEFNPIADLPNAVATVLAAGRGADGASADEASDASQGFATVAQPKMGAQSKIGPYSGDVLVDSGDALVDSDDDLGGGGKRATRKRGKRSSKRAPRKTKTTRKKTTRKKRRGKK